MTNHITTRQQLDLGVWYLDYRTMPHKEHMTELYNAHALYATSTEFELQQVKEFLTENPGELVIIDFNHFYDMSSSLWIFSA